MMKSDCNLFPVHISISKEKKGTHTPSLKRLFQALSWRLEWNPFCRWDLLSVPWLSWNTATYNVLLRFSHSLSRVSIFAGIQHLYQSQFVPLPDSAFVSVIKITNGPTHLTLKSEREQGKKIRHEILHLQSGVLLAFALLVNLNPHAWGLWLHPVEKFRFMSA